VPALVTYAPARHGSHKRVTNSSYSYPFLDEYEDYCNYNRSEKITLEFLILPDSMAGEAIAGTIRTQAQVEVIPHASGRPWIVGRWSDEELTWTAAGQRRVAVLGCAPVTCAGLANALKSVHSLECLDGLARALPGSFHLAASMDGRVRVQGSLSTLCQIFFTMVSGTTVAADRPQSLASLSGAGIVEQLMALRLLAPWSPWPLSEYCLWQGIKPLPTGCYLELDSDGTGRAVRWWTPPQPDTPLSVGADLVRAALRDAVVARTQMSGTLSADLSGGMDSTSLCFLAAGGAGRLLTTRWEAEDPADDDRIWAERAAVALPDVEHLVLSRQHAPMWFADLMVPDTDVEAPFAWIRTRARLAYQAQEVAGRGSTRHVTGHGGDELFFATPLHLHTLVRTQPLKSIRYVRAYRALYRWKLGTTLRGLVDSPSFGQWLARSAESLTLPVQEFSHKPDFGWWIGFRMPSWATRDAVETVRQLLREAALSDLEPLCPLRAQHAALQDVRQCGDAVRRVNQLTSRFGVSWQAPYIDDRVIEAALSIRFEDSGALDRYKPVLAAAMRGVVPEAVLGRATKAEYSGEAYAGLRRHRRELLELCEDMNLVRLGLVDADAFRSALLGLHSSSLTMIPLISTLGCEIWLRSLRVMAKVPALSGGPQ
jgi:asparagine synthase (glutamine-hydrolysing)